MHSLLKYQKRRPRRRVYHFPYDVKTGFGKGHVKISAAFGGVSYNESLARLKTPYHIPSLRKRHSDKIGKLPGDMLLPDTMQQSLKTLGEVRT